MIQCIEIVLVCNVWSRFLFMRSIHCRIDTSVLGALRTSLKGGWQDQTWETTFNVLVRSLGRQWVIGIQLTLSYFRIMKWEKIHGKLSHLLARFTLAYSQNITIQLHSTYLAFISSTNQQNKLQPNIYNTQNVWVEWAQNGRNWAQN